MKRIHVLLFLSALLSGCGSDGVAGVDPPVAGVAIDFSSTVAQVQTRGAALTSITEMYIYASYTGTANWKSASHCFDYMYDQYAHNPNGSGWTYTPLKYWPGESTDKISFFAYAPVAAKDKLTVPPVGTKNPTFAYTVPATESAQLDFLVASQLNCTNATGKVMFSMQHALAQVVVKVKNGDATVSGVTLSALRLTMPRRGTLTFGDTGSSGKQFTWAPASEKQDIDADVTVGGSSAKTLSLGTSTAAAKPAATFFLLPVSDPSASVQFHLTYTLTKNAGTNIGTSPAIATTIAPSATPAWSPGKIYTYTISILDDRIEIDGVTVKDFDANGTSAGGDIAAT